MKIGDLPIDPPEIEEWLHCGICGYEVAHILDYENEWGKHWKCLGCGAYSVSPTMIEEEGDDRGNPQEG